MNSKQIELVKQSWHTLSALEPCILNQLFYQHLSKKIPSLNTYRQIHSNNFVNIITHIINRLDEKGNGISRVINFSQRRLKTYIQPGYFLFAGSALLCTLSNELKENWTEELREAWAGCYTSLSNAVMEATYANDFA